MPAPFWNPKTPSNRIFIYCKEKGRRKVKPFLLETMDPLISQIPQKKQKRGGKGEFQARYVLTICLPAFIIKIVQDRRVFG
jgi:hypothetical protein